MSRIANGQQVKWRTYPDAEAGPEHKGKVVTHIEAGKSLLDWEMGRVGSTGWVAAKSADRCKMARYVVETEDGLRTVSERLLERQNPNAARKP
ncbi:MAG: hypothetical protein HY369_00545 [Candidatus Aenigmarchaeota archaeon]|nr:hypothetical protein [Candidatus Aenigmarchaeota archaeon]